MARGKGFSLDLPKPFMGTPSVQAICSEFKVEEGVVGAVVLTMEYMNHRLRDMLPNQQRDVLLLQEYTANEMFSAVAELQYG
jgi:hypothetical protein